MDSTRLYLDSQLPATGLDLHYGSIRIGKCIEKLVCSLLKLVCCFQTVIHVCLYFQSPRSDTGGERCMGLSQEIDWWMGAGKFGNCFTDKE